MTNEQILAQFNAPADAQLVKVYKNGNIQIRRRTECSRCNSGRGTYYIGVCNGQPIPSHVDNGVCFKCLGSGWEWSKEVLMTPENKAKHDAQLAKKRAEAEAKAQEEAERIAEAERLAEIARQEEEARIKAEKAVSQHRGNAGDKIDEVVTYIKTAWFEVKSFRGFGTDTVYIHTFADADGNKLVWKTSNANFKYKYNEQTRDFDVIINEGDKVQLRGTIKEHSEYKDEKQTSLTRCKVQAV